VTVERMLVPAHSHQGLRRDKRHMARNPTNLQDAVLNQLRKENIPVTVYLVNGVQLKGVVRAFDNFTVMLESEGKQLMVYKHAISTISPLRPVSYVSLSPDRRPTAGTADAPPPV